MNSRSRVTLLVAVAIAASLIAGILPSTAMATIAAPPTAPIISNPNNQITPDGTVYVRGTTGSNTETLTVVGPSGTTTMAVVSNGAFTATVTVPVAREASRITLIASNGFAPGATAQATLDVFNLGALPGYWRFILVDKYDFTLYLIQGGGVVFKAPVAIGMPGAGTPVGTWTLGKRQFMPASSSWGVLRMPLMKAKSRRVRVTVHVGRRHVRRWVRKTFLVKTSYYIHGTNDPSSIGTMASHGCVRLYNGDARTLLNMAGRGDPVVIRN